MAEHKDKEALLILLRNYPDAEGAFSFAPPKLRDVAGQAEIVVDTNVLLLPYRADASSLEETMRVYGELRAKDRLHVPRHVAREFVKHRPEHVAMLQRHILDTSSKVAAPSDVTHPILGSSVATNELNRSLESAKTAKRSAQAAASDVVGEIQAWEWDDPVSVEYRKTLSSAVMSFDISEDRLCEDFARRAAYKIPPGYKDAGKETNAIGDLAIWHEMLALGSAKKAHVIFVSGEEKPDWVYSTPSGALLPRYELIDEFRRASGGKCFYMIPLSKLLQLQNASDSVVSQVKAEECRASIATAVSAPCPECQATVQTFLAESVGSSALPRCSSCDARFHVHRLRDGISVQRFGWREAARAALPPVSALCPRCGSQLVAQLGLNPGATSWCQCANCSARFALHRSHDLQVICGVPVN